MPLSRPQRPEIFLASLVIHLLALAVPLSLLQIYDRILPSQSYGTTIALVIGVSIAIILEAILRYSRSVIFARMGAQYEAATVTAMASKLMTADVNEIEKRGTPWFNDALRAVSKVKDLRTGNAATALYEMPFILVYISLIAYVGGWLAVIPFALFCTAALLVLVLSRATVRAASDVEQADQQRRSLQWKLFSGIADIKASAAENTCSRHYQRACNQYMAANSRLEFLSTWLRENATLFGQLSTLLIVAFGALMVTQGQITTGVLAACTIMAGRSIGPGFAGLGYLARRAQAREASDKIDAVMALPDASRCQQETPAVALSRPNIHIANHEGQRLSITAGETVLLQASDPVRCAELLSMIAGLSHDAKYQIDINNQDIETIPPQNLRRTVSLVTRETGIVSGNILNNLTLFDPQYNQAAQALSDELGLTQFTDNLRNGLLTEVGPLAADSLSAGVTQRIALVRALVRSPKVLLLDNAGVDLDLNGAKRLAQLLQRLAGTVTIIMFSSRPELQAVCTRTIDMDQELPHD